MNSDDRSTNNNPLFNLQPKKDKVVEPLHADVKPDDSGAAVSIIRNKIEALYAAEPNAKQELAETEAEPHRSKHQEFMHELGTSGKSLAEIQTAWHQYYVNLPDNEKHEVWQEFYANHNKTAQVPAQPNPQTPAQHMTTPKRRQQTKKKITDARTVSEVKDQLLHNVSTRTKTSRSAHIKSLLFGFAMGSVVLIFMLFGFFNERFIAPFITPSRTVTSTPIILDSSTDVGNEPLLIIPKINVETPVVYDEPSIDEAAVQRALEDGVLHYATTPNPGERGNAVVFGHSSNNLLNSGKYKFIFVLLNRLEKGDTFMVNYKGVRYVYRIYEKKVVKPDDVSVLHTQDKPATMTLITCDPPGTAINRLIVVAEQISPDPATNVASSVRQDTSAEPAVLPSNAPSLWSRITGWLTS